MADELAGTWTYRSFNPTFVMGNQTPQEDALIFAEARLTLRSAPDPMHLVGTLEWPGRSPGVIDVLDVDGTWGEHSSLGLAHSSFHIRAFGRPGTETDGWEYEYYGHQTPWWPRGLEAYEMRPTLVGSVFRVKDHNGQPGGWRSPAGYVASFIAMKPRGSDRGLTGSWFYRSFHNNHTYPYLTAPPTGTLFQPTSDDPNVGYHGLILQEAVFRLETFERKLSGAFEGTIQTMMRGTIEWTGGVQTLEGEVRPSEEPLEFTFRAFGRPGTETDGWDFGYHGRLTRHWPKGVNQRPALVGSLNCFRPHDLTYGWAYPFIAVKQ
jgi:hypothetical protein